MRGALCLALALLPSLAMAEEIVAPATRDVSPPGITPSPSGSGPLVRVPVPPPPPLPPRWRRFLLPATTDAATFIAGKLTIHIAGVAPPAADATCPVADGTPWPCGQTALFSFRRFLNGRVVECYFATPAAATAVTAPCRIGTIDLAAWLLAAGWARPADNATEAYRNASASARCAASGIWRGEARPATCDAAISAAQ